MDSTSNSPLNVEMNAAGIGSTSSATYANLGQSSALGSTGSGRNVIIFVADGLRPGSVNPIDAPTLSRIRQDGVNFVNSHSLFPTFTTANASAIATGHYLGDTGDFSNTIYAGYPVFGGTPTPFIENDPILGDIDEHFTGNYLNEETLLAYARQNGYNTAAVGKQGPVLIQDVTQGNPGADGKVPVPQTVIIDDSTGKAGGIPLSADITKRLVHAGVPATAPDRSNGLPAGNPLNNGSSGNNTTPGTQAANTVQQQFFVNAVTKAILPEFADSGKPFAMVYWSRDPDGTQHNQGDSLDSLTPGINGPTSKAAVHNADNNLKQILDYIESNPQLKNNTDIFITADHGFSTISRQLTDTQGDKVNDFASSQSYAGVNPGYLPPGFVAIDIAHELNLPLYDADKKSVDGQSYLAVDPTQGQRPANGDGLIGGTGKIPAANTAPDAKVIVAANGGSDLIYVPDKDPATVQRIVSFLAKQDYTSGLFVDDAVGPIAGALPTSSINFKGSTALPAPTIVINFKTFATDSSNPNQSEVEIADTGLQQGQGMHGSFGRGDTFNNMAAIGPDFKQGYTDAVPVSNADVATTLAKVLGFNIPSNGDLQGRVLNEALKGGPNTVAVTQGVLKSAPTADGTATYLNYQQVGDAKYFDAAGFSGKTVGLTTSVQGDGAGSAKTFLVSRGDTSVITNFGGVGTGGNPTPGAIAEADTLKFQGSGLTPENLRLTQVGSDLVISFYGDDKTQVTLKNFKLEDLDNLSKLNNISFDGQTKTTDNVDVVDAKSRQKSIFKANTVTFLNDLNTTVQGLDSSDDVINAQGGNHTIHGGSGDDVLRGGSGNTKLYGDAGDDVLYGGSGKTSMKGGQGKDVFVLTSGDGLITVQDFKPGEDQIGLAGDLTYDQLSITQGTGSNAKDALIKDESGNLLAIVKNVRASLLTVAEAPDRSIAGPETGINSHGWFLTPAGKQVQLVDAKSGVYGDRPYGIAESPDGKTLIISNDGQSTQSLMVVDRASGKIVQTIPYKAPEALYIGVTFSPDGQHVYASAGGNNKIRVYDVKGQTLTEKDPILLPLPKNPGGSDINLYAGGLTISADGKTLYVADNLGDSVSVVDIASKTVTNTVAVGHNPYTVVLAKDGKSAYVSNWGEKTVSVIDLTTATPKVSKTVEVGTHPNAMALNPVKAELYVVNADSDDVSVINTDTNQVVRTIDLSPYPGAKEGSSPNAVTVSPDGSTLYVANATNNDVAVIQLGDSSKADAVKGLIPTAWYPSGLVLSPDGKELDVINAKGLGAGPNPAGPNPYGPPTPANQYVGSMIQGTLSQIQVPDSAGLQQYTQQVVKNNGFDEGSKVRVAGIPTENVIPLRPGDPSPIKHIIYVIKENRTFDQVFGSLGKGNGDPDLNLFGDESAPNQRALQKQFVTLDNFYSDAEVSADGWNWSTGALANTYVQKNWPANYSDSPGRNRPYDFEGGNYATSPGADPQDAFIWNKLSDAGIDYRNYGFRVFGGKVAADANGNTTEPRLAANTDLNFPGYNLAIADSSKELFNSPTTRIDEWLKEFNQYEADNNPPTVEFVRLPSDHTSGTRPGYPTPRAYMADNDQAVGELVDAVSHSPYWKDTAIFITEDDAQNGPDHIDAHRTIAQVISPYTQTGKVDSTFYSTTSMLRTMELLAGIEPMSQYDAAATPMLNSFTDKPNFKPYDVIKPTQSFTEKNAANAPLAAESEKVNWTVEDQNEAIENLAIWKSIKGANSTMPTPVTRFTELDDEEEASASGGTHEDDD